MLPVTAVLGTSSALGLVSASGPADAPAFWRQPVGQLSLKGPGFPWSLTVLWGTPLALTLCVGFGGF